MAKVRKRVGKRGVSWQIDYFDPNGKRVRQSFAKRKDAEAELGKRVVLIAENRYLDAKKDCITTLGQLVDEYTKHFQHQPSFMSAKKHFLKNFKYYWKESMLLIRITPKEIERYVKDLRKKPTRHGTIRRPASVNREVGCLRQMLKRAVVWDMIERCPFDKLDSKQIHLPENNKRDRFLSKDEIQLLLDECAKHLKGIVEVALHAGLRMGEVLGLQWKHIDFKNERLFVEKAPDNRTKPGGWVDMNPDLVALMKSLRPKARIPDREAYVFTKCGNRIYSVSVAFNAALKRTGIEGACFHTLRHTTASHMAMAGCTPQEIAEQLRHKNIQTTMRYMHLSPKHKKKAVNTLAGLTAPKKLDSPKPTCHKSVTSCETLQNAI
jgi:integrase